MKRHAAGGAIAQAIGQVIGQAIEAPAIFAKPMFIVFEGIDGSGKTTISNRVAARLAQLGAHVTHVRAEGRLASNIAENIRQFTRDQRNVGLDPFAELLLYTARERQQLQECVKPALARGEVVIADRYFYTPEVLAHFGRGVDAELVERVVAAARDGVTPDVTVLIDVDPFIARARRRAEKIANPMVRTSSRKGLAGGGLMQRLHDGYLDRARANPEQWLVFENNETPLDQLIEAIVEALVAQAQGTTSAAAATATTPVEVPTIPAAIGKFTDWLERSHTREPAMAAYLLNQLAGPTVDRIRRACAQTSPSIVAAGLRNLDDAVSWELREQLADAAPAQVALSLTGYAIDHDRAARLRNRLVAAAPGAVIESLTGDGSAAAMQWRSEQVDSHPGAVARSLAGLDDSHAWQLRDRAQQALGDALELPHSLAAIQLAASVRGLDGARAWQLRTKLEPVTPVGVILSVENVWDEASWQLRQHYLQSAPRPVLATLLQSNDARAWAMRRQVMQVAKEVLNSIYGMECDDAWALRDALAATWPSTVVQSLGDAARTPRGRAMVERQLTAFPANLSLLRHVVELCDETMHRPKR
jgi:dTMP kinase